MERRLAEGSERLSLYPIQEEPDANDLAPYDFVFDKSIFSPYSSVRWSAAVPDPLAANLGLSSTLSDAAEWPRHSLAHADSSAFYAVIVAAFASCKVSASVATEPDKQAPFTPPAGVASLPQPISDLSAIKCTPTAAKPGASLSPSMPSDATEHSSPSERQIIKLRTRANGNTSDSFIQHYIDFAFRSCSIRRCDGHCNLLINCYRFLLTHLGLGCQYLGC